MNTISKKRLVTAIALSASMVVPAMAFAKVSGQCGNCHTMHNSQDGAPMTGTTYGTVGGSATPNASLLRYGCIGCHTGTNSGINVGSTTIPFVLDPNAAPTYTSLAGGNFYWVATNGAATDSKGHNILNISAQDLALTNLPPGGTALTGAQLTCASINGCHGDTTKTDEFASIAGGHHDAGGTPLTGAITPKLYVPGTLNDMANSYRMLNGIEGIEDNDWEYSVAANDHNQYAGATTVGATNTISSLCANCHATFHTGAGNSSPWVRHPTDFDMGAATGTEYAAYNGATDPALAPYSFIAPVASDATSGMADVLDTVNVTNDGIGDGSAIVTCISCHRPHGSANADLLRWDYTTISAHSSATNDNNTGCFICHTTKDDI